MRDSKAIHPNRQAPRARIDWHRSAFFAALVGLIFGPAANPAHAAPGAISQVPLYVGPSVEPNVMFVADDSGSMEFTIMAPEDDGAMWLGSGSSKRSYYYNLPTKKITGTTFSTCTSWCMQSYTWNGGYTYQSGTALIVPTVEALDSLSGWSLSEAEATGVWRAWNYQYNKLYYNPSVRYTPWPGVNKNGTAYTNASPTAAWLDPYDPSVGTVNLTDKNTKYTTTYPGVSGTITVGGSTSNQFYPARYYAWTDSDGNGQLDIGDTHALVEITSIATTKTPTPPSSFPGGAGRTDCMTGDVARDCTYDEEIQNFANWFSYYRSRDLSAKNAVTKAMEDATSLRVGYATINNNNSNRVKVASMNLNPASGNKKILFDKIFQTKPESGTPLRTALYKTGLYYECKSGNIMDSTKSCPILSKEAGGMCQRNYTILTTDGFWSDSNSDIGMSSTQKNADGDGTTLWDGFPYGDDNTYTLGDIAMYFYERDLSSTLSNDVPASTGDKDNATHQHMTTFTVGYGLAGTLDPDSDDPKSAGFAWTNPSSGDPEKIDDLWHAAYNGRGEFFNAQDPTELEKGIRAAFASVSRGKSSSASVAFNTTKLGTDNTLYQASFNPSNDWAGALVAIALNSDGALGADEWNAADKLDATAATSRTILTYNDSTKAGIKFRTLGDLSTKQQNDLNMGPSAADGKGQERLDYLRGDRSNEGTNGLGFRSRGSVLGDIVYSNPVYVGAPELGYEDDPSVGDGLYSAFRAANISRPGVIYVGANDGMLHGFNASDGSEVMAYVPNMLFSSATDEGLHYLTDESYGHRYYVDLSPTVADVHIGGSWKTVLVGGYRAGARGLFALDVTDPSTFSEDNADNTVLWEFTSADDPNMGYSFSKPTIALMQNNRWAAVFGNGYNDQGSDGKARLYIVYIDGGLDGTWTSGTDYKVIAVSYAADGDSSTSSGRNGLSTPVLVDSNADGKADRVYAGDLKGNLWAFDLSSDDAANWDVAYKAGSATNPLFKGVFGTTPQPITSKPVVVRNPAVETTATNQPNILVFFGTGQYMIEDDKGSTGQQTFYGVWDNGGPADELPRDRDDLVAQTLDTDHSTADLRVTSDNEVNYASKFGWRFDLPTSGERVVVDPKVRGQYVFFNTLIPDPGTCNSKGYGWLMALKLDNGGGPDSPVYDKNGDGEVNDDDHVDGTDLSPSGIRMDKIPAGSNFLDDVMYTPDDEGNIDVRKIDAGISGESRRLSWKEIRQVQP
jgi:type IV pilus assembly protein PilY1